MAPFSTSFMTRNQDISFGAGSPIVDDAQSPVLTCRSSFSSFLVEPSTPCFGSGVFSFRSSGGSNTLEFATPISSMPSFAFFSPGSESVQANCPLNFSANIPRVDSVQEASSRKLLTLPDSSLCFGHGEREICSQKAAEVKKTEGMVGYRMSGIHGKRNRTIGLGEFDQLDLMVTESVIRWASCTHLTTATSLRSSLVC